MIRSHGKLPSSYKGITGELLYVMGGSLNNTLRERGMKSMVCPRCEFKSRSDIGIIMSVKVGTYGFKAT